MDNSLIVRGGQLARMSWRRCGDCWRPIPIGAGIGSRASCAGSGTGAASLAKSRTWPHARCCSSWRNRGGWRCLRAGAIRPTGCQIRLLQHPTDPITGSLSGLQPLQIQELSQQPEARPVFDSLLHQYHYLGYTSAVGQNVKYLVRGPAGAGFGLRPVWRGSLEDAGAGCLHWLDGGPTPGSSGSGGEQQPVFDFALGGRAGTGQPHFGPSGPAHRGGLAGALRPSGGPVGDVCGTGPVPRQLLSGGQLDWHGSDARAHPAGSPAPLQAPVKDVWSISERSLCQ